MRYKVLIGAQGITHELFCKSGSKFYIFMYLCIHPGGPLNCAPTSGNKRTEIYLTILLLNIGLHIMMNMAIS